MSEPGRLAWADLIRILALFGVVLLHSAAVPATKFGEISQAWWWVANFYDSLVRPCVPLFVMISGALLLDPSREQSLGSFYRRRVTKVVVPLLCWSVFYAAWRISYHGESLSAGNVVRHIVEGMGNPVAIHLWFLYLIISLYLVTPVFAVFTRHASIANQLYFAGLWFAATGLRPLVEDQLGFHIGLSFEPVTGFIGYFVLGSTLRQALPSRLGPLAMSATLALLVIAFAITLFGTYTLSARDGSLNESFYYYLAPNVMVMSICSYALLRQAGLALARSPRGDRIARGLAWVSDLGLGAYLVHAMILDVFAHGSLGFYLHGTAFHPLLSIPITALVAFSLSLLITWVARQLPGLRVLVP